MVAAWKAGWLVSLAQAASAGTALAVSRAVRRVVRCAVCPDAFQWRVVSVLSELATADERELIEVDLA